MTVKLYGGALNIWDVVTAKTSDHERQLIHIILAHSTIGDARSLYGRNISYRTF